MGRAGDPARAQQTTIKNWLAGQTKTDNGYEPWPRIRRFANQGTLVRLASRTVGRTLLLASKKEAATLYSLEWLQRLQDIKEQYPLLPLEDTQAIAEAFGITHPRNNSPRFDVVMTTDLLVTFQADEPLNQLAISVKPASKLRDTRVLELFAIEHEFHRLRGTPWMIVTDRELPSAWAKNLETLAGARYLDEDSPFQDADARHQALTDLASRLPAGSALADTCAALDRAHGLDAGTSLKLAYWAIANRVWVVDLSRPLDARKPLKILRLGHQPMGEARL